MDYDNYNIFLLIVLNLFHLPLDEPRRMVCKSVTIIIDFSVHPRCRNYEYDVYCYHITIDKAPTVAL